MIDVIRKHSENTLDTEVFKQDEDSFIQRQVLEDYVFKQYVIILKYIKSSF
jgi:hypothetical protein